MWEAINGAWLELQALRRDRHDAARSSRGFLDWVKSVSLAFDGSAYRTMLRNDAYWFTRLGTRDRARRQHRPHPRREVPRCSCRRPSGSAAASTISSGRRSCARSRPDRLSLGLPGERQAVARRRPPDPQPPACRAPSPIATRCWCAISISIADAYGRRGPSQRLASTMLARLSSARIEEHLRAGPARVHHRVHRREQSAWLGDRRAVS